MDPNQCFREIIQAIRDTRAGGDCGVRITSDDRTELAELLRGLAGWIERGGFYPLPPDLL